MDMELGNQFGLGVILAYALEGLKGSRWFPLLTPESTKRYKIACGGIMAFLATVGIHYTFDYNAEGHGVVMLMLPTVSEAGHALVDFAKQWAFQQAAYDGVVVRNK